MWFFLPLNEWKPKSEERRVAAAAVLKDLFEGFPSPLLFTRDHFQKATFQLFLSKLLTFLEDAAAAIHYSPAQKLGSGIMIFQLVIHRDAIPLKQVLFFGWK